MDQLIQELIAHIRSQDQRIDALESRLTHSVKGGSITGTPDTAGRVHTMQTTSLNGGEVHPAVQLMQHYGFSSVPLVGCRHLSAASTGINDSKVIVATHDPAHHPQNMKSGEVQLFDSTGQSVALLQNGVVQVSSGTSVSFVVGSKTVATLDASGDLTLTGNLISRNINLTAHVHHGVQAGNAITQPPANS